VTEGQEPKSDENQPAESQSAENKTGDVQQEASKEEQSTARKTPSKPRLPKQQVHVYIYCKLNSVILQIKFSDTTH
jgi:hypothetical protein